MPTRALITEVAPRTWFVRPSWVNAALFETDAGLVMVDAGFAADASAVHTAVRSVSDAPLHTVIFTHGHVDHAFGLGAFLDAGDRPRIVAHENVATRFRRYVRTADYNTRVNATQFDLDPADMPWPRDDAQFFWPDLTYRDSLVLDVGGEDFHLHHARGETDDATWVWVPGRATLACGDFWFNVAPNCGNPQKVQRYPEDWADTAEVMAGLGAEILLPGHSRFQVGVEHIRSLFTMQATYLRTIVEQTMDGLNAGLTHDEIVERVTIPDALAEEPSLQPRYDRPEFIARNVIRQYGGWWNGRAADLLPAPADARAREIVALAGGVAAGHALKALLVGGPSGGLLPAELADTPYEFEPLREAGAHLGSGSVVAVDERACVVDLARLLTRFCADEACGKTIPCRIGLRRVYEIGERMTAGLPKPTDLQLLEDLSHDVRESALCDHERLATLPFASGMRYFRPELDDHIVRSTCPAGVCRPVAVPVGA